MKNIGLKVNNVSGDQGEIDASDLNAIASELKNVASVGQTLNEADNTQVLKAIDSLAKAMMYTPATSDANIISLERSLPAGAVETLYNGMCVMFIPKATNTSQDITVNVNGTGAKAVVDGITQVLPAVGFIETKLLYLLSYSSVDDKYFIYGMSPGSAIGGTLDTKADKLPSGTENNFMAIDSYGNIKDSGANMTLINGNITTAIEPTASKISGGVTGNLMSISSTGDIADSGTSASAVFTAINDVSNALATAVNDINDGITTAVAPKADKVLGATDGNFAGLDAAGNIKDLGINPSEKADFEPSERVGAMRLVNRTTQTFTAIGSKNIIPFESVSFDYAGWHVAPDKFSPSRGDFEVHANMYVSSYGYDGYITAKFYLYNVTTDVYSSEVTKQILSNGVRAYSTIDMDFTGVSSNGTDEYTVAVQLVTTNGADFKIYGGDNTFIDARTAVGKVLSKKFDYNKYVQYNEMDVANGVAQSLTTIDTEYEVNLSVVNSDINNTFIGPRFKPVAGLHKITWGVGFTVGGTPDPYYAYWAYLKNITTGNKVGMSYGSVGESTPGDQTVVADEFEHEFNGNDEYAIVFKPVELNGGTLTINTSADNFIKTTSFTKRLLDNIVGTTLREYTEGLKTGYVLPSHVPENHGPVGDHAIDFTASVGASDVIGATGNFAFAGGVTCTASGSGAVAFGSLCIASGDYAFAAGISATASGLHSFAYGSNVTATNDEAVAFGKYSNATSVNSLAVGSYCNATSVYTTAIGFYNTADAYAAVSLGYENSSSGWGSLTCGGNNIVGGDHGFVGGYQAETYGDSSFLFGKNCKSVAPYVLALGFSTQGVTADATDQFLTIKFDYQNGNGYFDGSADLGAADYAEYFESFTGEAIPVGYFVSYAPDSDKIVIGNTDVIGIVSANPAIIGDSASLHWNGQYLRDEFDRYVTQEVEVTTNTGKFDKTDPETGDVILDENGEPVKITETKTTVVTARVVNPDYDPSIQYIPRSERPEWCPVGLLGKLWVRAEAGETFVKGNRISASVNGKATAGTDYRVLGVRDTVDGQLVKIFYFCK